MKKCTEPLATLICFLLLAVFAAAFSHVMTELWGNFSRGAADSYLKLPWK